MSFRTALATVTATTRSRGALLWAEAPVPPESAHHPAPATAATTTAPSARVPISDLAKNLIGVIGPLHGRDKPSRPDPAAPILASVARGGTYHASRTMSRARQKR